MKAASPCAALTPESRCFDYLYDFGDDWHHIVLVEDRHVGHSTQPMALRCIGGENARPPEDAGGAHGYVDFLAAVADPVVSKYSDAAL